MWDFLTRYVADYEGLGIGHHLDSVDEWEVWAPVLIEYVDALDRAEDARREASAFLVWRDDLGQGAFVGGAPLAKTWWGQQNLGGNT